MARVRVFRVLDRDYPQALRELSSPPDPLWIRGDILAGPSVAIVGTRGPTAEAAAYAYALAYRLARRGAAVWSGGAIGIDVAAHRGALDAGGTSIAVVGTGIDHCYPAEHAALYEEMVLEGGAIVSPFDRTQHATLTTFPRRNAVLAALTTVTVVIEAPFKSGARSTAMHARRLGRPLFVLPASPWEFASSGNLEELRLGARVLARERDLFDLLGLRRGGEDEPTIAEEIAARFHVGGRGTSNEVDPPDDPAASAPTPRISPAAPRSSRRARRPAPAGTPLFPDLTVDAHAIENPALAVASVDTETRAVWEAMSFTALHVDDLCVRTGLSAAVIQGVLLTLSLKAVLVEGPPGWFRRINVGKYSG